MTTPGPSNGSAATHKYAITAVEKQRYQLERLLKDPLKPAFIPPPPSEKIVRPAREMMKNVQGSSAGAGSGEFHVYKASRRREYERLKIIDDQVAKEAETAEFERRRREADETAGAKTAKNRAKRQKKKDRAKASKDAEKDVNSSSQRNTVNTTVEVPLKKRRLVNGTELVFKKPGEDDTSEDESDDEGPVPPPQEDNIVQASLAEELPVVSTTRITIVEDD